LTIVVDEEITRSYCYQYNSHIMVPDGDNILFFL